MRISIAMCTYNGGRFLAEQLDSLLQQQRRPDQVVVCDDGSTDNTLELLADFSNRAQAMGVAVLVHPNPRNLGYVRNFEQALALCDGDLIFLCDQDDIWHREKLQRYAQQFAARPALMLLHSDARLVDAQGRDLHCSLLDAIEVTAAELEAVHAGRAVEVLLRRNIATGATMALRRELVARALPVEAGWIHDEWLAVAAACSGGEVDCLEWPSIDYRQHGGNQIGAHRRSLRQKLAGAGPRRDFLARVAQRLESLRSRCASEGWLAAAQDSQWRSHIAHVRARAGMPKTVLARLPVVWQQWRTGNYHRYGAGARSLVADLFGWN